MKNIFIGIKAYFGAFSLISKLKLWKFFAVPMILSLVLAIIIFGSAYSLSDDIGGFIAQIWFWDWGKETFNAISSFFGGLLVIVIGLILFKHIVMALSGPFMGPVSEKIEAHILGKEKPKEDYSKFMTLLIRGIRINIRNLVMELLISIPLILLSFIPILNIVLTVILFFIQAYYAGFGNMDYTLERHYSYKDSVEFVSKNKGAAIGNGIIFILFLFVPIIGFIFVLPLSVTASTTHTLKILNKENLLTP